MAVKEQGEFEEYRLLHDEINFYRENIHRNRNYCMTLFTGIVAFGIKSELPILFIIAWFLIYYYWHSSTSHNESIAKISCYISVFLEGDETGLRWHTRLQPAEKDTRQKQTKFNLDRFTSPYFVMSLACMLGIAYYLVLPPFNVKKPLLLLTLMTIPIIALNCFITIRITPTNWKEKRDKWRIFWQQEKQQELE